MSGTGNELTAKFVKAHYIPSSNDLGGIRWLHKLIYEFWGFCVNGGNSLTQPGGFAPLSGVLMPHGFESGSAVLIASGTDGQTTLGMPFFVAPSVNWTSGSMVGRWLVTWQSSSKSTDDSIYPIIQVVNSSSIRIDVNAGGTPWPANMHPSLTTRTNINYRVVDFNAIPSLPGYTTSVDGLVLNLPAAYLVNSGQVTPQCRTRINYTGGVTYLGLTVSPSGTWTPLPGNTGQFTEATSEATSNNGWILAFTTSNSYITLMGAQDFLICHHKFGAGQPASIFHIEIPQRLYPQGIDPNPVVCLIASQYGILTGNNGYGTGIVTFNPPNNSWTAVWSRIRSLHASYFPNTIYPSSNPASLVNGRWNEAFFNVYKNKFMMSDIALSLPYTASQFFTLRMKLRRARWCAPIIPSLQRMGDYGEWINTQNGIIWPWDSSVMPYNVFLGGF
jgi:hypothetical protein